MCASFLLILTLRRKAESRHYKEGLIFENDAILKLLDY